MQWVGQYARTWNGLRAIHMWPRFRTMPKHFRDAGHFWGIAAGTPPSVIRRRIAEIDHTVDKSRATLDQSGRDEVASRHGLMLFSRADLDRVAEFQATLKLRFAKELLTLQAAIS